MSELDRHLVSLGRDCAPAPLVGLLPSYPDDNSSCAEEEQVVSTTLVGMTFCD